MSEVEVFVVKFLVTMSVVLVLSFVAENLGLKWAGILSGLPTGSAITLYFYALENGQDFAASSALYNMLGLVAMQTFILFYYLCGGVARRCQLFFAVLGGGAGYITVAFALSKLQVTPIFCFAIPALSFPLFRFAFRRIVIATIDKKTSLTWSAIVSRAGMASLTICLVTAVASVVGPSWAGLFSAFPTTLFPLLVIIHINYGRQCTDSIIKHVPDGLGSLLIYSAIIYWSSPGLGLYAGVAMAFCGALTYLWVYHVLSKWLVQQFGDRSSAL